MSFIVERVESHEFNPNFAPVMERLAHLQESYDTAKQSALVTRMEIIGLCEEQKQLYPQRSPEARFINAGYSSNGWKEDTIYDNNKAFKFRKHLLDKHVDVYTELAEACSPTQLVELAKADAKKTTTVYDAAQHFKRTGQVPTLKQIRGHLHGNTNNKFEFFNTLKAEKKRKDESEFKAGLELNQESENRVNPELNQASEFTVDPELSSDTELRNFVPLLNNIDKTSSEKIEERDVSSQKTSSSPTSNQACASPLISSLESCEVESLSSASSPNSEVVDVVSLETTVISTPQQIYLMMEKEVQKNYRSYSKEDLKWFELCSSLLSNYLKISA